MNTAHWLMERCGVAQPVVGDIVEEAVRRSSLWRWRQVAWAVWRALLSDATSHPVILIRGIAIGWFLLLPVSQAVLESFWSAVSLRWLMFVVHIGLRQQLNPLTGLLRILLAVPLWIAVGWLVRRASASPTPAAVVTVIGLQWALAIPSYAHLVFNAIDEPRFLPYALVNGIGLTAVSGGLLTGALWSRTYATP
jgi:hypothetical protein